MATVASRPAPATVLKRPRKFLGFADWETFVAAAAAGFTAEVFTHPADTIRARMQSDVRVSGSPSAGVIRHVRSLVHESGVRALYRGLLPVIISSVPANVLYYGTYDAARRLQALEAARSRLALGSWLVHMGAGLAAEFVASCVTAPVELVKQRLQVQQASDSVVYRSARDAVVSIWRQEGPRGFFRGFGATFAFFGPFSALFLGFNHLASEQIRAHTDGPHLPLAGLLAAGMLSASVAATIVNPLSVVRTQLQTQDKIWGAQEANKHRTAWAVARHIHGASGWAGFARGTMATVLWMAPNAGIAIALFTWAQRHLLAWPADADDDDADNAGAML